MGNDGNGDTGDASATRDRELYPVDEKAFKRLKAEYVEFLKSESGIQDEDELEKHVIKIQHEAYAIFAYQCIRHGMFVVPKIHLVPNQEELFKLAKEREGAVLLDVGCCFGTDSRKAAAGGWPAENIVATDVHPEFWVLGHKLYRSNPETVPITFIPGDIFNPEHLKILPPLKANATVDTARPTLSTLTSLNPLRGHVSALFAGALFHLFGEQQQEEVARAFAGLLSPTPGSMIAGVNPGSLEKGTKIVMNATGAAKPLMQFWHSPESWTELWDGVAFEKGTVKVSTEMMRIEGATLGDGVSEVYMMMWSVTRL